MTLDARSYIENLTEAILSTYHISTPITDIYSVVKALGGEVVEMEVLDGFYDGVVKKVGKTGFAIAVAKHQNAEDKKFSIACRLGHLFLHMGFQINENLWRGQDMARFRRFGNYEMCCQANEFAKALLMPKTAFVEAVKENTVDYVVNMDVVAKTFAVSEEMAKDRALSFGIATCEH